MISEDLVVEVKHRKELPQWIKDAADKAFAQNDWPKKIGVVWLHERNKKQDYVILRSDTFLSMLECVRKHNGADHS